MCAGVRSWRRKCGNPRGVAFPPAGLPRRTLPARAMACGLSPSGPPSTRAASPPRKLRRRVRGAEPRARWRRSGSGVQVSAGGEPARGCAASVARFCCPEITSLSPEIGWSRSAQRRCPLLPVPCPREPWSGCTTPGTPAKNTNCSARGLGAVIALVWAGGATGREEPLNKARPEAPHPAKASLFPV